MKRQPTATWTAEDTIEERFAQLADWERFEQVHNGPSLQADTATHFEVDPHDENCTCPEQQPNRLERGKGV